MLCIGVALGFILLPRSPRFAERAIPPGFIEQLRTAFASGESWPNKSTEVATHLVDSDHFPSDRPPSSGTVTCHVDRSSDTDCVVSVFDGAWDVPDPVRLIATWDRVTLRRDDSVWIPVRREVSWQRTHHTNPAWNTAEPL